MATRIELHDPELPGFIKTVIDTVEDSIKGEKKGPMRKVAAVAELERSINLPRFLPAPLRKMVLGLMIETVFKLVKNGAEALIEAARGDAESKAKSMLDDAEKKAKKLLDDAEKKAKKLLDDAEKKAKKLLDDAEKKASKPAPKKTRKKKKGETDEPAGDADGGSDGE